MEPTWWTKLNKETDRLLGQLIDKLKLFGTRLVGRSTGAFSSKQPTGNLIN
jgi:hypothetical protein